MKKKKILLWEDSFDDRLIYPLAKSKLKDEYDIDIVDAGGRFDQSWRRVGQVEDADAVLVYLDEEYTSFDGKEWKKSPEKSIIWSLKKIAAIRKAPVPVIFVANITTMLRDEKAVPHVVDIPLSIGLDAKVVDLCGKAEGIDLLHQVIKEQTAPVYDVQNMFPNMYWTRERLGLFWLIFYSIDQFFVRIKCIPLVAWILSVVNENFKDDRKKSE